MWSKAADFFDRQFFLFIFCKHDFFSTTIVRKIYSKMTKDESVRKPFTIEKFWKKKPWLCLKICTHQFGFSVRWPNALQRPYFDLFGKTLTRPKLYFSTNKSRFEKGRSDGTQGFEYKRAFLIVYVSGKRKRKCKRENLRNVNVNAEKRARVSDSE